ncbi:uncharacterized protein K02A2.6-like [Lutzomyia longipalpis]|uniref:uncharacterized protein K02A2.6-like n=1 Tax=Lutzomyia longipalpis TaxID=7200 RepID=UPI0024842781|nr:uncharacterized protein K02A2.6-like [Lutzomyia longipalpis]
MLGDPTQVQAQMLQTLCVLTEEVKNLKAGQSHTATPEALVDSLARSITPFTFNPESGSTFESWYNRYRDTFLEDGKALTDAARVRLLMRRLDASAYDRYANNVLPKNPGEISFENTVRKLTKLFSRGESLFCRRRKCLQLVKNDLDDFTTHAGIVNKHCEEFQVRSCPSDHFKALIFVLSLQSEKDVYIREQLLTKLETLPAEQINLEFLTDEARRLANAKQDSRQGISGAKEIKAIKKDPPAAKGNVSKPKSKASGQQGKPPRPCFKCGDMHFVADCPHKNSRCDECNQVGHKTSYCPPTRDDSSKKPKKFQQKKKTGNTNAVYSINAASLVDRKFLTVRVNNNAIQFQFDTAADVTIITRDTWKQIGSPSLKNTHIGLKDAQTNPMNISGELFCNVSFRGQEKRIRAFVSEAANANLFGIEWISAFNLWDVAPTAFCNAVNANFDKDAAVKELQNSFPAVFNEELGMCTKFTASIHLKEGATPIFRPKREVAFHARELVDEELQRLQATGVISPVEYSPWATPVLATRKPNGRIRICGDYSTGVNESIETHNYPIPGPDELFAKFSDTRVFSHIDLSDAYLQVPVDEESSKILTIHTTRGLFRFNRLPPGIRCAPGIFQELVETMLAGINNVIVYFDDICVATQTEQENLVVVKKVLQRLENFGFHVRMEKCKFFSSEIKFLGIVVDESGLHPDPEKVAAIRDMPAPKNASEVKSFLGAIQFWGKFIKSMGDLRAPLDALLKKNTPFRWTAECESAFQKFKEILTSPMLLTHYNPKLPILIAADASSHAIGGVAYHQFPDGSMKAFYHVARKLTDAEKTYSQSEKEGLALVHAVKKFHKYIYGRQFTLYTDHKPLLTIFGSKKGIPVHTANRLQRWALVLLGYHFDIKYISTENFGHADILSRLIANHPRSEDEYIIAQLKLEEHLDSTIIDDVVSHLPVSYKMIRSATENCPTLQQVSKYIVGGWPSTPKSITNDELKRYYQIRDSLSLNNNCVLYHERIVIPQQYRAKILKQLHSSHPGITKMKSLARSYVYWPGLDADVQHVVKTCQDCAIAAKSPIKSELYSWPLATRPWQRVHIDYAGPVNGSYYLLVIDALTKWPEIFRTTTTTSSYTISMLTETFARFGLPEVIVTDNGTQFTSAQFSEFCKSNGINHIRTCVYSPSSNGQAERFVDTLKRALKKMDNDHSAEVALQKFLTTYRITPNENVPHGKSPAEIMFGRRPRTIFDLLAPPTEPTDPVRNQKMEEQYNAKHGAKRRTFERKEGVYVKKYFPGGRFKWVEGETIERKGNVIYTVRLPNGSIIRAHVNQMRPRYEDSHNSSDAQSPSNQTSQTADPENSESDDDLPLWLVHQDTAPIPAQLDPTPATPESPPLQRPPFESARRRYGLRNRETLRRPLRYSP